jgi:hypothetical protein
MKKSWVCFPALCIESPLLKIVLIFIRGFVFQILTDRSTAGILPAVDRSDYNFHEISYLTISRLVAEKSSVCIL